MIRLTFLLRRRAEMSLDEFQTYWRQNHGPLVAKNARKLNVLRYVQVHTLDDPINEQLPGARGAMEPPYDGVAELWWNDREEVVAALEDPAGQAAGEELLEDEKKFIDLARSPLWFAYEYPQVNPTPETLVATERSPLVKYYYPLRHVSDVSTEELQLYWRTSHGPLIRSLAPAMRVLRYVQVHRYEDALEAALREARGTEVEPYAGHAELWFDRGAMGLESPERERAVALAYEDERKFIDFPRSSMWLAKERVFVDAG